MLQIKLDNDTAATEVLKACTINCHDLLEEITTRIRWATSSRDSHEEKLAEMDDKKSAEAINRREDVVYYGAEIQALHKLRTSIMDKAIQSIVFRN